MFDNIVANNEINFNELEQKIYKFVCELGCNILKNIIENMMPSYKMKGIRRLLDIED